MKTVCLSVALGALALNRGFAGNPKHVLGKPVSVSSAYQVYYGSNAVDAVVSDLLPYGGRAGNLDRRALDESGFANGSTGERGRSRETDLPRYGVDGNLPLPLYGAEARRSVVKAFWLAECRPVLNRKAE